jgi:NADH:ubiquinone oxidoreductase subunit 2 (subunit N)
MLGIFWNIYWQTEVVLFAILFILLTFFIELKNSAVTSLCLMIFFSSFLFLSITPSWMGSSWDFGLSGNSNILFLSIFSIIFFIMSIYFWQIHFSKQNEKMEFSTLLVFIFLISLILIQVVDLLEAFLLIESLSFIAYILAGFEKNSKINSSSGIQYLIIGSVASIFLILSTILIYYQLSTTNFWNIESSQIFLIENNILLLLSSGFLLKNTNKKEILKSSFDFSFLLVFFNKIAYYPTTFFFICIFICDNFLSNIDTNFISFKFDFIQNFIIIPLSFLFLYYFIKSTLYFFCFFIVTVIFIFRVFIWGDTFSTTWMEKLADSPEFSNQFKILEECLVDVLHFLVKYDLITSQTFNKLQGLINNISHFNVTLVNHFMGHTAIYDTAFMSFIDTFLISFPFVWYVFMGFNPVFFIGFSLLIGLHFYGYLHLEVFSKDFFYSFFQNIQYMFTLDNLNLFINKFFICFYNSLGLVLVIPFLTVFYNYIFKKYFFKKKTVMSPYYNLREQGFNVWVLILCSPLFLNFDLNFNFLYSNIIIILTFIIGSFLYKVKGAPFHIWAPTIYTRMPTSSMVVLVTIYTLIFCIYFFQLFFLVFSLYESFFLQIFLWTGFFSLIFGFIGAFDQKWLKKFLVYSSVGHVGFLLFTFISHDFFNTSVTLIMYLLIYILSSFLLWFLITFKNSQVDFLSNILSSVKQNGLFYFIFVIIVFSMSGIPPLSGFFVKFDVLTILFMMTEYLIAFLTLLVTVASFYYYLRLLKIGSFENFKTLNFSFLSSENFWQFLKTQFMLLITFFIMCYFIVVENSLFFTLSFWF